jgi:hypothetical protein
MPTAAREGFRPAGSEAPDQANPTTCRVFRFACAAVRVVTSAMRDELMAERSRILDELAIIETSLAELAQVLRANLDAPAARKLAERIHVNKVAERDKLEGRLVSIDASLQLLQAADEEANRHLP